MDDDQSLGKLAGLFETEGWHLPGGPATAPDTGYRALALQDAIPRPHPDDAPKMSDADRLAMVRERGRALGRDGGYLDAIPVALTTGLLGNLPDYPPAAYEAVKAMLSGSDAGRAYDESLEEQRGMREGLAETFPRITFAGNTAATLVPAGAAAKLVTAATRGGRIAKGTAAGAAAGAAQGFAGGEGWDERVAGAVEDAMIGAAIGGATQLGSTALDKIFSRPRRRK